MKKELFFAIVAAILILVIIFDSKEQAKAEQILTEKIQTQIEKIEVKKIQTCKEFEDNALWSSSYGPSNSENYYTWNLGTNCKALGENCYLKTARVEQRALYMPTTEADKNAEGYVMISQPDEAICNTPENGVYSEYLSYERYNGSQDVEIKKDFYENIDCYGIKIVASEYFLLDVFKMKYTMCWNEAEAGGK